MLRVRSGQLKADPKLSKTLANWSLTEEGNTVGDLGLFRLENDRHGRDFIGHQTTLHISRMRNWCPEREK